MKKVKIYNIIFIIFTIFFIFLFSIYKRQWQFNKWKENRDFYFANNYLPAMSTMDAYFWLRYARDEITGKSKTFKKDLRRFPDRLNYPHPTPLFSKFLSKFYNFFSSEGFDPLYTGSIKLCNILASLFIIPFIIYIYLSGGYLAGVLGALIGTFSYAYYIRASTGRVDTDGIILFVPILISLLMLLIIKLQNKWFKFSITALIALTFKLLAPIHIGIKAAMIIYFILLVTALLLNREDYKTSGIICIIYLIFCNPIFMYHSFNEIMFFIKSSYFLGERLTPLDTIKKTIETVSEARKLGFQDTMKVVFMNEPFFFVGIIGALWYFIKNFKKALFITPVFIVGLLSFFTSIRFSMFLPPFIGIGIAYCFVNLVSYILKVFQNFTELKLNLITFIFSILFFFLFKNITAYNYIPKPHCPTPIVEDILKLKKTLPKNSVFFAWWDLGYAYEDIGRFITLIDGGIEDIPRRFAVATGFLLDNETKFRNLIVHVANHGFKQLKNIIIKNNKNQLKKILLKKEKLKYQNIYVVFSIDLLQKAEVLDNYAFLTTKESQDFLLKQLPCSYFVNNEIICNNFKINLSKGKIYGKLNIPLEKIIYSENGKISNELNFSDHHSGKLLEIIKINETTNSRIVRLISKDLYPTILNKMYLMGVTDKNFKEVFNHYPFLRVFKIK